MKVHKIKYKNLEGEEVARGYSISIKKEFIESLNLQDKQLKVEIVNNTIVIREKKENEEN